MDHPFAAIRHPRDPRRAALLAELLALCDEHPGKVPVLILGPRGRAVIVLHGDDCTFLPESFR